jgi:hypothetical protein
MYGVEPICAVLPIAPSTYHARKVLEAQPERRCPRPNATTSSVQRDRIRTVWQENFEVYGVRKVWRELKRKHRDEPVARCTVARLMSAMGLQGCGARTEVCTGHDRRLSGDDAAGPGLAAVQDDGWSCPGSVDSDHLRNQLTLV